MGYTYSDRWATLHLLQILGLLRSCCTTIYYLYSLSLLGANTPYVRTYLLHSSHQFCGCCGVSVHSCILHVWRMHESSHRFLLRAVHCAPARAQHASLRSHPGMSRQQLAHGCSRPAVASICRRLTDARARWHRVGRGRGEVPRPRGWRRWWGRGSGQRRI